MQQLSFYVDTISIHAPTRGATEEQDAIDRETKFQSTLPREERHRSTNAPAAG